MFNRPLRLMLPTLVCSLPLFSNPLPAYAQESLFAAKTGLAFQDRTAYELGTVFSARADGDIEAVRVFAVSGEYGNHALTIWNNATDSIVAGPYLWNFAGENAWQTFALPSPLAITAGVPYTVSLTTGEDAAYYAVIPGDLTTAGSADGHLAWPAHAGVFTTQLGTRPTQSYQGNNYLRDVVFRPRVIPDRPTDPVPGPVTDRGCDLPLYPTAACTGVPEGWTPKVTIQGDLIIDEAFIARQPGRAIEDYLVTGIIDVRAPHVTIRRTRSYGRMDNFTTSTVYGPLLIEDSEVVLPPGATETGDYMFSFGVSNYTCRRCKVVGRSDGWRVGASSFEGSGPVIIEHSYARLQITPAQCAADDPHGDGIQGYGASFFRIHHNTIDQRDDHCPTAPIFVPDQGNDGASVTDNLMAGGSYSLRLTGGRFPEVTGNRIVHGTWGYGPLDVACEKIETWNDNSTVEVDWTSGRILRQVEALEVCR